MPPTTKAKKMDSQKELYVRQKGKRIVVAVYERSIFADDFPADQADKALRKVAALQQKGYRIHAEASGDFQKLQQMAGKSAQSRKTSTGANDNTIRIGFPNEQTVRVAWMQAVAQEAKYFTTAQVEDALTYIYSNRRFDTSMDQETSDTVERLKAMHPQGGEINIFNMSRNGGQPLNTGKPKGKSAPRKAAPVDRQQLADILRGRFAGSHFQVLPMTSKEGIWISVLYPRGDAGVEEFRRRLNGLKAIMQTYGYQFGGHMISDGPQQTGCEFLPSAVSQPTGKSASRKAGKPKGIKGLSGVELSLLNALKPRYPYPVWLDDLPGIEYRSRTYSWMSPGKLAGPNAFVLVDLARRGLVKIAGLRAQNHLLTPQVWITEKGLDALGAGKSARSTGRKSDGALVNELAYLREYMRIGRLTPQQEERLQVLAQNPDPDIARSASTILKHWESRRNLSKGPTFGKVSMGKPYQRDLHGDHVPGGTLPHAAWWLDVAVANATPELDHEMRQRGAIEIEDVGPWRQYTFRSNTESGIPSSSAIQQVLQLAGFSGKSASTKGITTGIVRNIETAIDQIKTIMATQSLLNSNYNRAIELIGDLHNASTAMQKLGFALDNGQNISADDAMYIDANHWVMEIANNAFEVLKQKDVERPKVWRDIQKHLSPAAYLLGKIKRGESERYMRSASVKNQDAEINMICTAIMETNRELVSINLTSGMGTLIPSATRNEWLTLLHQANDKVWTAGADWSAKNYAGTQKWAGEARGVLVKVQSSVEAYQRFLNKRVDETGVDSPGVFRWLYNTNEALLRACRLLASITDVKIAS
jgi:hypothetical protein